MNNLIEISEQQISNIKAEIKKWGITIEDISIESEYSSSMCAGVIKGKIRITDKSIRILSSAAKLIKEAKDSSSKINIEI